MSSIRIFKHFLAVVQHGNFSAAGREIGLTAAALGLQMRALESELNQALFDRSGRSVVLNTQGRAMVAPIKELVARYDSLASLPQGASLAGAVQMGALVSALMGSFADCLWALTRKHPHLEVKLLAGLSADFAQKVERGELDAAVVTQPPVRLSSNLTWSALYAEPMVLIVPRRPHFSMPTEALDILAACPFIRFDHQAWTGHLVNQALAQCGGQVKTGMELNSVEAIVALVRQGFGVSIVPRLANVQWTRDRALRILPLPGVAVQREVGLLERRQHSRAQFTDAIKAYFATRAGAVASMSPG